MTFDLRRCVVESRERILGVVVDEATRQVESAALCGGTRGRVFPPLQRVVAWSLPTTIAIYVLHRFSSSAYKTYTWLSRLTQLPGSMSSEC
jgi:hypothetical protein